MLSWIQCFSIYTAIVCSEDSSRFNDLLGYTVIMINEGRQFKYQGWLTYDEKFRQSAVKHMVCLKCGGEHKAVQCSMYRKK